MPLSGQKTVAAAGTAVKLGTQEVNAPLMVKALDTNTGAVALGNVSEDVTVSNGLRLEPGDSVVFEFVGHLGSLWLDAAVNGEGVSWIILNV